MVSLPVPRLQRVLAKAQDEASFDALCISDPVNIRYLTGLAEGSNHLLLSADGDLMLVPWMFHDRARAECPGLALGLLEPPLSESITCVIRQRGWSRIALVERETRLSEWRRWCARMGVEGIITVSDVVMQCRAIKDVPARMREIHAVVRRANAAAIAAIKPGVNSFEVDAVARAVITDAGFNPRAFRHGLGHAIGLEVHEAPRFHFDVASCGTLAAGMVMTVEPGIYVEGLGGIRLENNVLVTETGCKVLGSLDLDWTVLR